MTDQEVLPKPFRGCPPLPQSIPMTLIRDTHSSHRIPSKKKRSFPRSGCHLIQIHPDDLTILGGQPFIGTLRIVSKRRTIAISGDLYWHDPDTVPEASELGIPSFPRSQYRYYIRGVFLRCRPTRGEHIELGLEPFRFHQTRHTWFREPRIVATMRAVHPESSNEAFEGTLVSAESEKPIAHLKTRRLCRWLRSATIEIDTVANAPVPRGNGQGIGWRSLFKKADWNVLVETDGTSLNEPQNEVWSAKELHSAMLTWRRRNVCLDAGWHYHLLCVPNIEEACRGVMFDALGNSNGVPREGAAVSSNWQIPNDPQWGRLKGKRFSDARELYFRTAAHEIGHAMGLTHTTHDTCIMNPTSNIAKLAAPETFPNNVKWDFSARDRDVLRHAPDVWVRPGGLRYGDPHYYEENASSSGLEGVTHLVQSRRTELPLGAPLRLYHTIINNRAQGLLAPKNLNMSGDYVYGAVIGPDGQSRTFDSFIHDRAENSLQKIGPQQYVRGWLTLVDGHEGALFPDPGLYTISVTVAWEDSRKRFSLESQLVVEFTQPTSRKHWSAAHRVNAIGRWNRFLFHCAANHFVDARRAESAALKIPELRPHWLGLRAIRVGARFKQRGPNYDELADLLDEGPDFSGEEIIECCRLVSTSRLSRNGSLYRRLTESITAASGPLSFDASVLEAVNRLQKSQTSLAPL